MSLRLQLFGTIALVLLGTLALGAFLTYQHALDKIDTEMRAAIAVGSRIAHNAVDDVEEVVNPRRRLELLAADFDGDRHLKAFLIEPGGATTNVSKLAPPEDPAPEWFARLIAYKPLTVTVPLPSIFANHGAIRLETDARNEISEVWEDVQLYMAILGIFCLASLIVTLTVLARGLTPLQRLTAAFETIGRNEQVPEIPEGPRELTALTDAFNRMVRRLSETEEKNRALRVQLDTVQEEERSELARNLHDEVSPLLFCIGVDGISLERAGKENNMPDIVDQARSIQNAVKSLKANVKTILCDLRPKGEHALGLHGAVEELVAFWKERCPDLEIYVSIPSATLPPRLDAALQAIVGESVSNALKHAKPRRVEIDVWIAGPSVRLEVRDDGGGFRDGSPQDGGFGIMGMKERASNLGGTLSVAETMGKRGVAVRACLPLSPGTEVERPAPLEALAS